MKLTIATYWRPSGQNINRPKEDAKNDAKNAAWGVSPNEGYDVPVDDDERDRLLSWQQEHELADISGEKEPGRRRSAGPRAAESRRVLGIEDQGVRALTRDSSWVGEARKFLAI